MGKQTIPHENFFLKYIERKLLAAEFYDEIKINLEHHDFGPGLYVSFKEPFKEYYFAIRCTGIEDPVNKKLNFDLYMNGIDKYFATSISVSKFGNQSKHSNLYYIDDMPYDSPFTEGINGIQINFLEHVEVVDLLERFYGHLSIKIKNYKSYKNHFDVDSYLESLQKKMRFELEPEVTDEKTLITDSEIVDMETEFTEGQISSLEKYLDTFEEKVIETVPDEENVTRGWVHIIFNKLRKNLRKLTIMDWMTLFLSDYKKLWTYLKWGSETSTKFFNEFILHIKSLGITDFIDFPGNNFLT